MEILVCADGDRVQLCELAAELTPETTRTCTRSELPLVMAEYESASPRWVWADTAALAPELIAAGVRVTRCLDLRLARTILRHAAPDQDWPDLGWRTEPLATTTPDPAVPTLWDESATTPPGNTVADLVAERIRQRDAVGACSEPARMRLLLAAESAGALIAAEIEADGLPWDRSVHEALLTEVLGPRPRAGVRPARLEGLAAQIRKHLAAPALNPDSPVELLRSLRRAGLDLTTTSKWEIARLDHPVVGPLLEYKKLARLLSANGWAWLDSWIHPASTPQRRDRFRPDYVPGGVVTGRWATSGGGALQLPKQIRAAVRADPGWRLVVADAAQIEPRVLAAMSGDTALATAGQAGDLYVGLVEAGIVGTRAEAKVAMLGALYGATTGEAGLLMPRLMRAYPRATGVVEQAARTGEHGGTVRTWLGRTSPPPPPSWHERQAAASQPEATDAVERRARQGARDWGRFTRNFVVQGTAAEWALCWMGEIRRRLAGYGPLSERPHLVFFLHDEVIVHAPQSHAEQVADEIRASAAEAGRLLFGRTPVEFPLDVAIVENYAEAE
ncbi:bifunctional 3'-5' exonuclease/DNA polymerase [Ruania halotolerans]|uniref:bifunctional 3'-5' exonuclease/DNA polymerase n=1 Tax=Ruania halotolerans TaxID=2897773 RepID=UPI001E2DE224|nr:bifunctional 3'-5' exonuclease/DNA polymerase [Ruania halotolerans]UFU07745.1 bifunctional 3'-5' exonuclease/DNA polymerase [Ruania halotolerans]